MKKSVTSLLLVCTETNSRRSESGALLCLHGDLDTGIRHLGRLCSFVAGIVDQYVQLGLGGAKLAAGGQNARHRGHVRLYPVYLPWPQARVLPVHSLAGRFGFCGRSCPKIHFSAGLS